MIAERPRGQAVSDGERTVPYYCPYCGGEDLRPHEDQHGAWECRECTRVFSVKLIGLVVKR
jgi:ribosomal protein L37AE/L43A